jgi:hypothetical protein
MSVLAQRFADPALGELVLAHDTASTSAPPPTRWWTCWRAGRGVRDRTRPDLAGSTGCSPSFRPNPRLSSAVAARKRPPDVHADDCHGALRGTHGIVYRIDENSRIVHVLDIDHRSEIYHRPQQ